MAVSHKRGRRRALPALALAAIRIGRQGRRVLCAFGLRAAATG